MGYQTVNPFSNEVVASFEELTDAQAMKLLAQAQKTFESWSQKTFLERAEVCWRAAMSLRERPEAAHVFLGSVASKILRHAPVPAMIVPRRGRA